MCWWKATQSIAAAARAMGVSFNVAKRWIARYLDTKGSVACAAKPGRMRILAPENAVVAYDLLVEDKIGPAKVVANLLKSRGLTEHVVHKTTVIRAAKIVAKSKGEVIRTLRGRPQKALTAATIEKRLNFCFHNQLRTTWRTVMFTDRKRFIFAYPGTCVHHVTWVKRGERREAFTPNHPLCVNVYAGLTWYGVNKLHIVAGSSKHKTTFKNKKGSVAKNVTQAEYKEVLMETLLPEAERIFRSNGASSWTFQQDNDPAHRNAGMIIDQYNREHATNIKLLENWPPSSPDLSPIENLWGIVQSNVDAKGCKTFAEFATAVHTEWKAVTRQRSMSLVCSIRRRIEKCIHNGGSITNY